MLVPINMIALAAEPPSVTPIGQLGAAHGLSDSSVRMLTRYFGLNTVATHTAAHLQMCAGPIETLVKRYPELLSIEGLLIHAKTQTHNTFADTDWLNELARQHGLGRWETLTLSMNHCASALSACQLVIDAAETRPAIILTGEKCFHPTTCRQSGAALGELPAAMLVNHGHGRWQITASRIGHAPKFHANPVRMGAAVRREFDATFGEWLQRFIEGCNREFFRNETGPDLVVPYNLNLPLLQRLASHFGWGGKLYTDTIASIGHLFCSDVFYNLTRVLPDTRAERIFCFAAGMGATFAGLLIERNHSVNGETRP